MIGQARRGADPRVAKLLDEMDVKYSLDDDGDFRVVFELLGNRTQQGVIESRTTTYGNWEIRQVWSVAMSHEGPLEVDLANALLVMNAHLKVGSWRLMRLSEGKCFVAICVQVAADTDGESLMTALQLVLQAADELESKASGEDAF